VHGQNLPVAHFNSDIQQALSRNAADVQILIYFLISYGAFQLARNKLRMHASPACVLLYAVGVSELRR
jgi:hypothetical protein